MADTGYPPVQTVPPRPMLSYPVEQRRAIVEGLVGDHENARHTAQLVRYRTGQTDIPPPPRPPGPAIEDVETLAEAPPEVPPVAAAPPIAPFPERAVPDERTLSEAGVELDAGGLSDFIRDLVRDTGPPRDEPPLAAAGEPAAEAPRSAAAPFFGWIGDLFGAGETSAAEGAATSEPAEEAEQPAPPAQDASPPAVDATPDEAEPDIAAPEEAEPEAETIPSRPLVAAARAPEARPDAPRPGPARAELERLIEPPPPAPGRSAPSE